MLAIPTQIGTCTVKSQVVGSLVIGGFARSAFFHARGALELLRAGFKIERERAQSAQPTCFSADLTFKRFLGACVQILVLGDSSLQASFCLQRASHTCNSLIRDFHLQAKGVGFLPNSMAQALQTAHMSTHHACSTRNADSHFRALNLHTIKRVYFSTHSGKMPISWQRNRPLSLIQKKFLPAMCVANREDVATTVLTESTENTSLNGFPQKQVITQNGAAEEKPLPNLLEVDTVTEGELKENGFRSTRRTKLVCTIGPACSSAEQLEAMAMGGMNVARLNLCHGTKEWHSEVIRSVRRLNAEKGYSVAVMMDTEGSEIRMGDLGGASSVKTEDGEVWVFTVRKFEGPPPPRTTQVNYEAFAEDIMIGDELVVDGGMVRFEVAEKVGPDVHCRCIDPGLLLPRANLTFWRAGHLVREGNSMLPTISSKDWIDIDFGIAESVDFIAISFVKTADVIKHLKSYIAARSPQRSIGVLAKIESCESLKNLRDIILVSDGAMVARGDLGAQIPLEQVPSVQQEVVHLCRQLNKPVIVASQLLESMIEYPTPTRAEVADVSEMVRQRVDALMLSGESAMGQFPEKALSVLRTVSLRIEEWCREEKFHESLNLQQLSTSLADQISEQICNAGALMANKLEADAIFVYTKGGYMASLLSRNRPDCPIFAFTDSKDVRIKLNLRWGLIPFRLDFSEDMEVNLRRTFSLLKARGMVKAGDLIIAVSDIAPSSQSNMLQSIQVRRIP